MYYPVSVYIFAERMYLFMNSVISGLKSFFSLDQMIIKPIEFKFYTVMTTSEK